MSVIVMSRVFYTKFPSLEYIGEKGHKGTLGSPVSKLVMLAIADSCDDYGNNSWNGVERLCLKTNLSPRSVSRATIALVQNGYLIIEGTTNPGTNIYSVVIDKLGEIPPKKDYRRKKKDTVTETHRPEDGRVPSQRRSRTVTVTPDSSGDISNPSLENASEEMPTPATKGDPMDIEKYNQRTKEIVDGWLTGQHKDYAHRFPDRIVPITEKMETLWHFVSPQRKSKQYGFWIQSCDELISACAEFGVPMLDDLYKDWMGYLNSHSNVPPFSVSGPQSLVKSALAKAAMLRGGNKASLWGTNGKSEHKSNLDI